MVACDLMCGQTYIVASCIPNKHQMLMQDSRLTVVRTECKLSTVYHCKAGYVYVNAYT